MITVALKSFQEKEVRDHGEFYTCIAEPLEDCIVLWDGELRRGVLVFKCSERRQQIRVAFDRHQAAQSANHPCILILGRKTRVQFSAPIHLRELVDLNKGHERTVRMAQRILRVHFRNLKTATIGPDLSHRRNLVKGLVNEPAVRQAILDEAERENISPDKARAQALRYANEIASDYTYTAIRFFEVLLSWFWNKIYDGVKVNHIESVQKVAQGHEIIYVPCHRSHIDYLLLSYLLFRNGLTQIGRASCRERV